MPDETSQPSDFSQLLENFTHGQKADVLKCLANLSNEEVFTPPDVANQMLDLLPNELWSDPNATFLDPASKSGVFLREIAKRLIEGLKEWQPDLKKRLEHIFKKQLFALSITELTGLISRRSVYCSKCANSKWSVVTFAKEDGNIHFHTIQHEWVSGRCKHCGASQQEYERDASLETHAYEFIHPNWDKEFRNMRFDVIISNPPYQLNDGGGMGTSAGALYDAFVDKAISLQPRYMSMIIPARWYSGGKGLDEFRKKMLSDRRLRVLVDYFDANECFPGIDLSGGVCFFLWDRDNQGNCKVISHRHDKVTELERENLDTDGIFVRFNESVTILNKIQAKHEKPFIDIVSTRNPFGLPPKEKVIETSFKDSLKVFAWPQNGYVPKTCVSRNHADINKIKVFISKAYGERGDFPYLVLAKPFVGEENSVCTETYLQIGSFDTIDFANNVISYIKTKFFRWLVLLKKNTQNAPKDVYQFVPMQDFSKPWTDSELYEKYKLSEDEIAFIESMIRPME